jgi:predicted nucleotidyltransferase
VKKGVFEPRTLELGLPRHACLALGDVNGDGKADIVVGNMAPAGPVEAWVEVWKRR